MNRERILAVAVLMLTLCVVFLAYRVFVFEPMVVKARAFELVDESGHRRALLGISPEGTVALGLFDQRGRVRSSMGLLPNGEPVTVMRDEDGKVAWGAP